MKKIFYLFSLLVLMACSSSEKLVVTNIQDLTAYPEGSVVYALPRTRIMVGVEAVSTRIVPGPYARFAKAYLGIDNAPLEETLHWKVSDVDLKAITEADPVYCYAMSGANPEATFKQLEQLKAGGYILTPGDLTSFGGFISKDQDGPETVYFSDLSVKRYLDEEADVPLDLPVMAASEDLESLQEKAKSAADFIIKIRKRRFKLLAGQYEVFPDGKALEISVRELDKLEEDYLSLFIGKTYQDTVVRRYTFTPGNNPEIERKELCRFSEESGFHENGGNSGRPIVLDLRNLKLTSVFRNVRLPYPNPGYENTLLYRIPDKALVRIIEGSAVIYEGELKVSQYGVVVPLGM